MRGKLAPLCPSSCCCRAERCQRAAPSPKTLAGHCRVGWGRAELAPRGSRAPAAQHSSGASSGRL